MINVLAIEGGGSHTRVVLGGDGGGVLREARGGPASALHVDRAAYPAELLRLIDEVLATDTPPARIGCAGPMDRQLVSEILASRFPGTPLRWYSEGEIALGVYGLSWGISVVAGTGSSSRAMTRDGAWIETGGFGPQFDDLGSGYWIGREGIAAVLRAEHGRGPATRLRDALFARFDLADAWDLVPQCVGNGHVAVPRVAAFAAEVCALASEGDDVATEICAHAAQHLADLVLASARRAGLLGESGCPVVPTGGVFRAREAILAPFEAAVRAAQPEYEIYKAVPDPVIGLLNLLSKSLR